MTVRLQKPWQELTPEAVSRIPGQLGVFELADKDRKTIYIGFAGGRSLFGLRGELESHLSDAVFFRLEVNTAYRTRHRELLMAYHADNGVYPDKNTDTASLGRLSPLGQG